MNLNSNRFPKGLITLQGIFNPYNQMRRKGHNIVVKGDDYIPVAIADGKTLNLGKVCSETEQESFIHLSQEYNDIIAWTYEYLKGFDPSFFQHTIDLNPNTKSIRKKKRD